MSLRKIGQLIEIKILLLYVKIREIFKKSINAEQNIFSTSISNYEMPNILV